MVLFMKYKIHQFAIEFIKTNTSKMFSHIENPINSKIMMKCLFHENLVFIHMVDFCLFRTIQRTYINQLRHIFRLSVKMKTYSFMINIYDEKTFITKKN